MWGLKMTNPKVGLSPEYHAIDQSSDYLIQVITDIIIDCSRVSIRFGWHEVTNRLYQAEYELEQLLKQNATPGSYPEH